MGLSLAYGNSRFNEGSSSQGLGASVLPLADKQGTFHRGEEVLVNFRVFNGLPIEQGVDPDLGPLFPLGPNGNR